MQTLLQTAMEALDESVRGWMPRCCEVGFDPPRLHHLAPEVGREAAVAVGCYRGRHAEAGDPMQCECVHDIFGERVGERDGNRPTSKAVNDRE